MKKIKLSVLTFCFMSFISCSKEDNSVDSNTKEIIGTWTLTELEYTGFSNSKIDGMSITIEYSGTAENIEAKTTFQENGEFESQGEYDVILTSEGMTIPYRDLSYASTGNYTMSGNSIEITNFVGESTPGSTLASSEKSMTIDELTSNKLILDFIEEITITEGSDEAFISTTGQYVFTR
jgi:hypothetical protein